MKEYIIQVNNSDTQIGKIEKLQAHQRGVLHRAFSIFIFNSEGNLLLQQRAADKYHSAALWTNSCCSHPNYGESLQHATQRRLMQEMGLQTPLNKLFDFIYKTKFDNGLIEHEYDHVFLGVSDRKPIPNPNEVMNWKYMPLQEIERDIEAYPHKYTSWFKICFPKLKTHYNQH